LVAQADGFVLTASELEEWSVFLEQRRDFRGRLRNAENRQEEIARTAAVTNILLRDHPDLISDEERRRLWRRMAGPENRRAYVRQVLGPQIVVDEAEVREIFDSHRENYRKARGVKALEIFLWAPEDLKDLRAERRALLDRIRSTTDTPEAFRQAALAHSDATSAYRGGSIGTLLEDQVGGDLRQALFTTIDDLTEIVQSPDGLFLFWIVRRVPAKENRFEDVAAGIEAKLRKQKLQTLITTDSEALRTRHALTVVDNSEPPDPDAPVLHIDGRFFTLRDLDLDTWERTAVERRGMAILYGEALQQRGIEIDRPDAFEFDWLVSRRILNRLVAQAHDVEALSTEAASEQAVMTPSKHERWTFDLLRVEDVDSPEALFAVFRARREVGKSADLTMLQEVLKNRYGLHATITSFDDVPASSVGGRGPEIHTTLKNRLSDGEMSKPMHLADRHQVVVIVLEKRRVDEEAGIAAFESAGKRRSRRDFEDRIVGQLLQAHRFRFMPVS
jgi:hypothetical protein